jgi:hypothetical protein
VRARLVLLVAMAALGGCEPDPGSAAGGSCAAGSGTCVDILSVSDNLIAQAVCLEVLGPSFTFQPGEPCPTSDLAGVCTRVETGITFAIVYSAGPYTPETAAADCASRGGSFQPP